MTLMQHRGPYQLNHVENLNWTATSSGRCGIQNSCGHDIRRYFIRLRGNLASGTGGHYDSI